jgi:hypoxanthine phosphoribosyltransferase
MNSRVLLASLLVFSHATYCMEPHSDLTLADFKPLITKQQIAERIQNLGQIIDTHYCQHSPLPLVILAIMNGALPITADLMRTIQIPTELQHMQASSYGQNGTEAGQLTLFGLDRLNLEGKHVLLVDDIFDTGVTISRIKAELLKKNPASLKSLVLLHKIGKSKVTENPDFVGFPIADQFVIGYGLDYKELYRGLPDIWVKKN